MTQLESLRAERKAIENDFKKIDGRLNDWTHDLLLSRMEMLDSMISIEEYNA
jgi:hypothetical protein